MAFTDKDVMDALKLEWESVLNMIDRYPKYSEAYVNQFIAMTKFAEKMTGKKYTATEDGVIEY